jgi:hypothetical protein
VPQVRIEEVRALDRIRELHHHCDMGFFRSPFLYVPIIAMFLAVIVLEMIRSGLDAVYYGSIIVVFAAVLGYEVLRRRRLADRDRRSGSGPED